MTPPTTAQTQPVPAVPAAPQRLRDLFADGFYLLLIKRGQLPSDTAAFKGQVSALLDSIDEHARRLGIPTEDVHWSKYALCAAIDEAIMEQPSAIRASWEASPLQLQLYGTHLAGDHFFDRLEELRAQGAARLQALEVFHYCLLLGFLGRYRLEGPEKWGYLTARLGDEIAFLKGERAAFAPCWRPPDRVSHRLRPGIPYWAPLLACCAVALGAWLLLDAMLARRTDHDLASYQDVIQMPARTAHLTITLP